MKLLNINAGAGIGLVLALGMLSLSGCGVRLDEAPPQFQDSTLLTDSVTESFLPDEDQLETILDRAESLADPVGRSVLQAGRKMVTEQRIVVGNCWDYIHAVYLEAGLSGKLRTQPFRGKKPGPYAALDDIRPGDWLYYLNRSFSGSEHSGIFVAWTDRSANEALILSYPGQERKVPGRYKVYDLTQTYNIIRGKKI